MPAKSSDILERIGDAARALPDVEEGMSCSQAAFKTNGKAFLFAGMQGGRCKLMFKLKHSLEEASQLAAAQPDDFQVGANGWVTVRFSQEKPVRANLWKKWLKESFQISEQSSAKAKRK